MTDNRHVRREAVGLAGRGIENGHQHGICEQVMRHRQCNPSKIRYICT
jgi:hypothetical protein